MINCSKCSTLQDETALLCSACGSPLSVESCSNSSVQNWENRDKISIISAIYKTTHSILFDPYRFFSTISTRSSLSSAILYLLLTTAISILFIFLADGSIVNHHDLDFIENYIGVSANTILVVVPILLLLGSVVSLFITAALYQIMFLITGSNKKEYQETTIGIAYSQGIAIFTFIPFIGPLVVTVWGAYIQLTAMAAIHKISRKRVFFVTLLPLIVIVFTLAIITIIIASLLGSSALSSSINYQDFFK
jgi:hypothetical protein